jgi:hypothetical protein
MRTFSILLVSLLILSGAALAADIDGKWIGERKMNRDGQDFVIKMTFNLKADGAKLTGNLIMAFGDNEFPPADIKDGKIDGNKFTFTVVMSTPNGDMKSTYEGAIDGKTMKGTSVREGGEPRPFEARKQ